MNKINVVRLNLTLIKLLTIIANKLAVKTVKMHNECIYTDAPIKPFLSNQNNMFRCRLHARNLADSLVCIKNSK